MRAFPNVIIFGKGDPFKLHVWQPIQMWDLLPYQLLCFVFYSFDFYTISLKTLYPWS